eukprot:g5319.t1
MQAAPPPSRIVANASPRTRSIARGDKANSGGAAGVPQKIGYRRKVSLHIGVSAYCNGWNPLKNATRDALALQQRFRDVLGFDDTHTLLDAEVTKEGIQRAFQKLAECPQDDLVIVTYSGHGAPLVMANGHDKGFLVPVDAPTPITLMNVSSFVSMDELGTWGDSWLRANHVVFLLDCCFSGLSSSRGMSDGRKKKVAAHLRMRCRYVINAGKKDEVVGDGHGTHSPFVTALLQSSAGTGNDEECDVETLKKEIENRVADMKGVQQTPTGGTLAGDEGGCAFLALPSLTNGGGLVLGEAGRRGDGAAAAAATRGAAAGGAAAGGAAGGAAADGASMSSDLEAWFVSKKIGATAELAARLDALGVVDVSDLSELDADDLDGLFPKKLERKRFEKAMQAQADAAREKAAREKAAREKAAREKAAREKAAREKAAREKAAREKAAREKAAREKAAREKAAREK